MKDFHFDAISAFGTMKLKNERRSRGGDDKSRTSLNYYGNAHGVLSTPFVTKSVVLW